MYDSKPGKTRSRHGAGRTQDGTPRGKKRKDRRTETISQLLFARPRGSESKRWGGHPKEPIGGLERAAVHLSIGAFGKGGSRKAASDG